MITEDYITSRMKFFFTRSGLPFPESSREFVIMNSLYGKTIIEEIKRIYNIIMEELQNGI